MTALDDTSGTSPVPTPGWSGGARRNAAVLVTGAGGEVGHGLISAMHAEGRHQVVAIDVRKLDRELRSMCAETFIGDVCDASLLQRLLAMYEVTEIYHLAALLSTRAEFTPETAHEVNVTGTLNLLRMAAEQVRTHGHRVRFMFPSSVAVYGFAGPEAKRAAGAVGEDEHLQPHTMYGCNKLYCENLGRYYSDYYRWLAQDRVAESVDFRCVRFPGLISAVTTPSGGTSDFAPEMIHAAAAGEPYACFVRPDTRIPFMVMPDAIDAMLALAAADEATLTRRVYNVSSFNPSAQEFADIVRGYFPGAEISFEPDEQRQAIVDSWPEDMDVGAARRDWGFAPRHDLAAAFETHLVPAIRERYR